MLNNSIYSASAIKEKIEKWLKNNNIGAENDFTYLKEQTIGATKIDTTRSMLNIQKPHAFKQRYRPSSAFKSSRKDTFVPWDEYFRTQIWRALKIDQDRLTEVNSKKTLEIKGAVKGFKELSLVYK